MFKKLNSISRITLISLCLLLSVYRISHVEKNEIGWDILGYYMPLPATFIHHDLMLENIDWLKKQNEEKQLTGTLYIVSSNDEGEPMYVFLFGMAFLFLPFFFLGHGAAMMTGAEADGFSMPYQYAMVIGGILYTIIGLIYFRKVLLHFFSEKLTAILMLIIVLGTNYIHHLTLKDLETVNVLFMLVSIITWNTIQWHAYQRRKNLIALGMALTLMALVKPSESLIVLLPLLWGVDSFRSFIDKFRMLFADKTGLCITIVLCLLLAAPQIWYWKTASGHFIYDTYKNPGVGLDLKNPHIMDVLFSYRKGWFVYTPVMIFSIIGFYFLYKNNRKIFLSILIYFLASFYILSSWTYWYYGAAYSCRPVITSYPLLAICFGYFLLYLKDKPKGLKLAFAVFAAACIFLNQFQWWQLKNYILDPYRTTKDYYWAIFLKTSADEQDRKLLLVNRDFTGAFHFDNPEDYLPKELFVSPDQIGAAKSGDSLDPHFYKIMEGQEFAFTIKQAYADITGKDHAWIRVSMDLRRPEQFSGPFPCVVFTMMFEGANYDYHTADIHPENMNGEWVHFEAVYLTPEVRQTKDLFMCYIWNRGKQPFEVRNYKVEAFEPKERPS